MQKCSKCKLDKNDDEFAKNSARKNGLSVYCKICNSERARLHYKDNEHIRLSQKDRAMQKRAEIRQRVNEIKAKLGCSRCPESDYRCLDFHHVNPTDKTASVSKLTDWKNWSKIELEMQKCIVLCSNCHRKTHALVV